MSQQLRHRAWCARLLTLSVIATIALTGSPEGAAQDRRPPESAEQLKLSFAPVVSRSAPAVVNVYSRRVVQTRSYSPFADDPFFRFFDDRAFGGRERIQQSLGSGVILREDGVVVTNNHVVEGALDLRVVLNDRREFDAELIVADDRTDLAVLRIDTGGEDLPALELADTGSLAVGDLVLAIGNPFGVGQTVTNGIVSALGRTAAGVSDYSFFIQTDAAINPGNSGGALVDLDGRLVGVNTAIFSRSGGSNGIGFAIPAELVGRVVESALTEGRIIRPWFGAKGQAVTRDFAEGLGLDRPRGVLIDDVFPDGPAAQAGVQSGDVILAIAGNEINDEDALRFQLATINLDTRVDLTIWRDGQARDLTFSATAPPEIPARDERALEGPHPLQGATVVNLSPAYNEEVGIDPMVRGVAVVDVQRGSAARYYGFRPGMLIEELEGETIETTEQLQEAANRFSGLRSWRLIIVQGGQRTQIRLRF